MKYIPIQTAQNVQIQVALASVGERILAFIIDLVVKFMFMYALELIGLSKSLNELYEDSWSLMATQIIIYAPLISYTLYSEILSNGYTIGKKILNIRVVSLDSYKVRIDQYFVRWIFNLVDIFTLFGGLAFLSTIFTSKSQRFGDLSAGTAVVKVNKETSINDSLFMEVTKGYQVKFPMVTLLSDRDVQIIKTSYYKSKANQDYKTIQLIRKKIDSVLNVPSQLNDHHFIEQVIADYNYVTKDLT